MASLFSTAAGLFGPSGAIRQKWRDIVPQPLRQAAKFTPMGASALAGSKLTGALGSAFPGTGIQVGQAGTQPSGQAGTQQTTADYLAMMKDPPQTQPQAPVAPVAPIAPTTGGGQVLGTTGQTGALDQALREAEMIAAQRTAQEEAEQKAEVERLTGEYAGLQEQLGFRRTTAEEQAALGREEIGTARTQALGTLSRLRGETEAGREADIARAETGQKGALSQALGGLQDVQRGIRSRLSAIGGYAGASSALPALMGLSERDYVQDIGSIRQETNQFVQDISRAAQADLSQLAETEGYVETDALQKIAELRLNLNTQLGELNLAQTQGDREKITMLTNAINQSRANMIDIDAQLSDYKNNVNMQKTDIQAKAQSAASSAAKTAQRSEEGYSLLMQVLGGMGRGYGQEITTGLDQGGVSPQYSGYIGGTEERKRLIGASR